MEELKSYSQFLEKARHFNLADLGTDHWENQIQHGKYYRFYKEAKPGIYVLDFTQQKYLYVNEIMACYADYSIPDLMTSGLSLALKLWHPDDLKIYDQYILPTNMAFLKNKGVTDYSNYLFTCNYRVRQRKGNYRRVEQCSFFSKSYDDGMPLMAIGFLRDITNRTLDNSIIHTIEHIQGYSHKLELQKIYNPDVANAVLTHREIEILHLIIEGKDSRQIAQVLGIEKFTVDNHRKNMLRKSKADNMVQVALMAYKTGFIK